MSPQISQRTKYVCRGIDALVDKLWEFDLAEAVVGMSVVREELEEVSFLLRLALSTNVALHHVKAYA